MRHRWTALLVSCVVVVSATYSVGAASLLSKRYEYRADVMLEIGTVVDEAIRLDNVRFRAPRAPAGKVARTAGLHAVDVALSNMTDSPARVGLAIALFDAEGRLVGVASGGSGFKPIKADRQRTIRLVFDDVNAFAAEASAFQISVEIRH